MKKIIISMVLLFLWISSVNAAENSKLQEANGDPDLKLNRFNNITLEMSIKPFKENNKDYIAGICREIFEQWSSLTRHADIISVMLWTSDGSEILDYSGDLKQSLEYAKYVGNPNTKYEPGSHPDKRLSLHERAFVYMETPPEFNYEDLKYIVSELKKAGKEMTGKTIRVGATFDPGPEFAKSEFKYKKHPEICMGATMGAKTFVCSYSTLNADSDSYAGFPDGIKQDTPFGVFFGRQSQHFLTDLGFDFLWLSNGFGFGMETWSTTGVVFDGEKFHPEKIPETREKIIRFWSLFRKECPDFRIETRGTNLSTGIDLATDGVDLKSIYNGGFDLLPPPNSPWAALDGDFGLELAGYMSRIAELPDNRYLFRYYAHDPWWINSPWLDRYGREPHDIYLPMAVSRIDSKGEIKIPTHLNILTIDNSFGEMPVQVPDEITPHILQARRTSPDQAGPVVWVYPFDEYHKWALSESDRLEEIYYGDWFIRQAINEGFPVNTVVSTTNFTSLTKAGKPVFNESVLVSIVPPAGSALEKQLMKFVKEGGKLLVYGPALKGSQAFLEFLNVKTALPLSGEFRLKTVMQIDNTQNKFPMDLRHIPLMSGGGIETQIANSDDPDSEILAQVYQNKKGRDVAIFREKKEWNGGALCYVRGTNSVSYKGGRLLRPDNPAKWFSGSSMMRYCLAKFGYSIYYEKKSSAIKSPVNCISRNDNAYFFSGFVPNLTVEQRFKFPQGAPIFTGVETELKEGFATYRFPKAYQEECRVFIEQEDGIVSCFEVHSGEKGINRRIGLKGLKNATVRIYPPASALNDSFTAFLNSGYPYRKGAIECKMEEGDSSVNYIFKNISGQLIVSW